MFGKGNQRVVFADGDIVRTAQRDFAYYRVTSFQEFIQKRGLPDKKTQRQFQQGEVFFLSPVAHPTLTRKNAWCYAGFTAHYTAGFVKVEDITAEIALVGEQKQLKDEYRTNVVAGLEALVSVQHR